MEVWDVDKTGLVWRAELELWGSVLGIEKVLVQVGQLLAICIFVLMEIAAGCSATYPRPPISPERPSTPPRLLPLSDTVSHRHLLPPSDSTHTFAPTSRVLRFHHLAGLGRARQSMGRRAFLHRHGGGEGQGREEASGE